MSRNMQIAGMTWDLEHDEGRTMLVIVAKSMDIIIYDLTRLEPFFASGGVLANEGPGGPKYSQMAWDGKELTLVDQPGPHQTETRRPLSAADVQTILTFVGVTYAPY